MLRSLASGFRGRMPLAVFHEAERIYLIVKGEIMKVEENFLRAMRRSDA